MNVLKDPKKILAYLDTITAVTNANRESLGFNPAQAYEDAIKRERLWVVVDNKNTYLGHLLFGGKPPQAIRIFQIYVDKNSRGKGVAALLIKEITGYAEQLSCLNLRADVASDLNSAIKFWQAQGFDALAPRRKQNASGRQVLLFYKRLSTPSLLPLEPLPLNLTAKPVRSAPNSYVIDLNIFISLLKKQADEKLVGEIIKASMAGEFSLFVTPEFKDELHRAKKENNPFLELAESTLPVLERIKDSELQVLQDAIREIIFPNRSKTAKNAAQDESDLRHLAYCIQNAKTGFITSEKAILSAKNQMYEQYGLEIFSPQDFQIEYSLDISLPTLNVPLSNSDGAISVLDITRPNQIASFVNSLDAELTDVSKVLLKPSGRGILERKAINVGDEICAVYCAQTKGIRHNILEGYFVALEGNFTHREPVFEHILECFIRLSQTIKADDISFSIRKEDFDLEKICLKRGFQRSSQSTLPGIIKLHKIPSLLLVTKANWQEFQSKFNQHTAIKLPAVMPIFKTNVAGNPIIHAVRNMQGHDVELLELETFISPTVLMLPQRTGIIIPIHATYASDLLSRDEGLLPFPIREEALMRLEKVYYRNPAHAKNFKVGMPIIFYESGNGRGAIGCARIIETTVTDSANAVKMYRRYGVLNEKEIKKYANKDGIVHVIIFDNFKAFSRPVPMKRLQELGCAKANLAGPEKLPFEQLSHILHEGMEHPSKDVIISIQPNYVAKILNGKKTIELRKKPFPTNGDTRIWIYSTSPTSAIEATAIVSEVQKATPAQIWRDFGNKAGISKSEFDEYFTDSEDAYALSLTQVRKLTKSVKLDAIKAISSGFTPPQYFRYIGHNDELFDNLLSRLP